MPKESASIDVPENNSSELVISSMKRVVGNYPENPEDITIVTICSHSSLQIFDAAKRAGFNTLGIIVENDPAIDSYDVFPKARPDHIAVVPKYSDFIKRAEKGNFDGYTPIFIPHGSGVEYLKQGSDEPHGLEILSLPTYGNRRVIPWEADRSKQREWLQDKAGLIMPREYTDPNEIDGPIILKLKGAPGGRGAVILSSREEYDEFMAIHGQNHDYDGSTMQQFVPGTRYYYQYLVNLDGEMEFFGIDRRDESDADEFYKLGSRSELMKLGQWPTFNVTGNIPVVARESNLMRQVIPAGRRVIEASRELMKEGLIGPFCLETIETPDNQMYVFEISARIVAGSNVMVDGSPYGRFGFRGDNDNYADWMMQDIALAAKQKKLSTIIT